MLDEAGCRLALAYQNQRLKGRVEKLAVDLRDPVLLECDVTDDDGIADVFARVEERFDGLDVLVHSIAYALRDDLGGDFSKTGREGFRIALDVSAYSLLPLVRSAAPLMERRGGGSVVTMTFQASERVFPGYNIMGTAKAALENEVRQLAAEYGGRNIRVNAISAGPLETLAARGIHGFLDMKKIHAERGAHGAEHHPRRGGQDGPVPVQRPVQRRDGLGDTRGRGLPHHGRIGATGRATPLRHISRGPIHGRAYTRTTQ